LGFFSLPPEGNVFQSIKPRWYVLRLCIIESRVLADAAMVVERKLVSRETAVDNTFAIQTRDVCNSEER